MGDDGVLDDTTRAILMSKGGAGPSIPPKTIFFLAGLFAAGVAYIVAKGAWNTHVAPLYSRKSNPRKRNKSRARRR